jgi:hypothetical protein
MIVNDLNVAGIAASPKEAYTPLIIDADAVLTLTVALQCFQPVPWRNHQILQGASTVQVKQLSTRYSLKGPKARHVHIGEQRFRLPGSEGADHQTPHYYAPRNTSRDSPYQHRILPGVRFFWALWLLGWCDDNCRAVFGKWGCCENYCDFFPYPEPRQSPMTVQIMGDLTRGKRVDYFVDNIVDEY